MSSTRDMKGLVSMWHGNDMRRSSICWVREYGVGMVVGT